MPKEHVEEEAIKNAKKKTKSNKGGRTYKDNKRKIVEKFHLADCISKITVTNNCSPETLSKLEQFKDLEGVELLVKL